jgi:hypothetical protein
MRAHHHSGRSQAQIVSSRSPPKLQGWAMPRLSLDDGCFPAAVAVLLYLNTLPNGFVYDDHPAIEQNPCVQGDGEWMQLLLRDFWGTQLNSPSSHHSYRPLSTLTLRLNRMVDPHGGARGFHAVNVIIHGAVSYMLWDAAKLALGTCGRGPPLLASLLFAVHPVNSEAVAYCVGRADLLAALLGLAGLRMHRAISAGSGGRRGHPALSAAALQRVAALLLLAAGLAAKVQRLRRVCT